MASTPQEQSSRRSFDPWVLFALIAFALLASFAGIALQTSSSVRDERSAVQERVGWLRRVGGLGRRLNACDAEHTPTLVELGEIAREAGLEPPPIVACSEAQLALDRDAVTALEQSLRGQTGRLSASLGDSIDRLYGVAFGAMFTAVALGAALLSLVRLRRALAEQADALARKALESASRERALRTNALIIAHEINNPLLFLRMSAELMQQELATPGTAFDRSAVELLEAAIEAGDRIGGVARDLQSLGRADPDALEIIDVRELIDQTRRLVGATHGRLAVEVTSVPLVRANAARLGQVLLNLVRNAEDATRGLESPAVTMRARAEGDQVLIEVQDNGAGIAASVSDRLFTPFATSKGAGGTGLGLYVSRGIVESFGGKLTLEGVRSGGAVARIVLPAA